MRLVCVTRYAPRPALSRREPTPDPTLVGRPCGWPGDWMSAIRRLGVTSRVQTTAPARRRVRVRRLGMASAVPAGSHTDLEHRPATCEELTLIPAERIGPRLEKPNCTRLGSSLTRCVSAAVVWRGARPRAPSIASVLCQLLAVCDGLGALGRSMDERLHTRLCASSDMSEEICRRWLSEMTHDGPPIMHSRVGYVVALAIELRFAWLQRAVSDDARRCSWCIRGHERPPRGRCRDHRRRLRPPKLGPKVVARPAKPPRQSALNMRSIPSTRELSDDVRGDAALA